VDIHDLEYPAGEKQRLHRRDTPHHLKNKRINQQVDKEKVATIIAQALKKRGEETSSTDAADGQSQQEGQNALANDTSEESNTTYGTWSH